MHVYDMRRSWKGKVMTSKGGGMNEIISRGDVEISLLIDVY